MKTGSEIHFEIMNEFTGINLKVMGTVIGHAPEVKKMWPKEYAELEGDAPCLLVKRTNIAGHVSHYCVWPEEIIRDFLREFN